jgi:soluble lytic murein transglycosylase-like protein
MLEGLANILLRIAEIQNKFIKLYKIVKPETAQQKKFENIHTTCNKQLKTPDEVILSSNYYKFSKLITDIANKYNISPKLIEAIIKVESNFNPYAISKKGAKGLMQLLPETAQELGVKDIFNPWENIDAGVRYFKKLLEEFKDLKLALAAYNAGPEKVRTYNNKIPPFKETQDYVKEVLKYFND